MKKFSLTIWPTLIWSVVIFYLLSMPTSGIDKNGILSIWGIDKVIHLGLFFVLAFLACTYASNSAKKEPYWIYWIIVFLISAYGLGMEFYQKFFTARSFSLYDALFDSIGAIVGMAWTKKSPYGNRGRNQN